MSARSKVPTPAAPPQAGPARGREGLSSLGAPFAVLFVHRRVIEQLVLRDLRGRYANSVMGISWAFIQPLALLALYTFVFALVLRVRFGGRAGTLGAALYLFCGMLPWLAFAEGVSRSASVILENVPLIKKVVFPSEILPAYVVGAALVTEAIGLGIFLVAAVVLGEPPSWTVLALPLVVVPQVMLTLGLGWLLAGLNVFLRDVGQLLGLALTLWMFVTPIFYPAEMVPERFQFILVGNPMRYVVEGYRAVLLEGRLPALSHLLVLFVVAFLAFQGGGWFFRRSKRAFVDVI